MAIATLFLERFADPALTQADLLARLAWLRDVIAPRLDRFLGYYRNPMTDLAAALPCGPGASFMVRPYRQYQEIGLPARITGFRRAADGSGCATGEINVQRKEVVIENDIAWRMNTLVDFVAGRMPAITSTAADPQVRRRLTRVIESILGTVDGAAGTNGRSGLGLLQELILHGAISGAAWMQLRPTAELLMRLANGNTGADAENGEMVDAARWLRLEILDAAQVCPLGTQPTDSPAYFAVLKHDAMNTVPHAAYGGTNGWLQRVRSWFMSPVSGAAIAAPAAEEFSFDLFGPTHWQRYQRGVLVEEGENALGITPFVRYENAVDPATGTRVGPVGSAAVDVGLSEVEPLIGLQDELNTRLSDRAYRVTMTSFRMYLGKGIEDFTKRPIGPGQMWGTDNPQATIEAFGGDQSTPSEDSHINEIREALDKISGVSPVAAGLIRGKLGNLTSAVALRLTLIALLAGTERKRAALTRTLETVVRMALEIFDKAGIVKSAPEDRGIDVNRPTALPESDMDRLTEAQAKLALGVPREVVLTELGYGELILPVTEQKSRQQMGAGEAVGEGT